MLDTSSIKTAEKTFIMTPDNLNNPWDALKEKVDYLKQPSSYHETCSEVISIETHMSWVFLTDNHAYKLKKPVSFSYLDFSGLQSRLLNCHKEVILNQYLAPDIYLGTIPFLQNKNKDFIPVGCPDNDNTVVDWFVKMKRFARDKTLDQAIITNKIDTNLVLESAQSLAQFYVRAKARPINAQWYIKNFERKIIANKQALSNPVFGLDAAEITELHEIQLNDLHKLADTITHRVKNGHIIECHGDLRPEHICLDHPPIIFDRLEFNPTLRVMDVAEELAYLSLECDLLGNAAVSNIYSTTCEKAIQDTPPPELCSFYKCIRACLRAKISAWHLNDSEVTDLEKWYQKANMYLNYASSIK